jgi:amino acid transporter
MSPFLGTLKAVSWSFLGIRKNSEYQKDLEKLNPLHIIAVAILMVIAMVAGLIVLVNFVVAK